MTADSKISQLAWTGERMIPHASDAATELYHWQRYMYFKPWYEDAKVIDAASGEGYGAAFAAIYASQATGVEISAEAVTHGNEKYPNVSFIENDVCKADYSDADVVVSFETIEHIESPEHFLDALSTCKGKIVISTPNRKTHSPGNKLEDKPLNQFHTVEWTPNEFAEVIRAKFPNRQVRFLSQEQKYPGLITEGLDDEAMYCIAVIGDGDLPQWPRLGISIPTCNNFNQLQETMLGYARFYPGQIEFAVVANGTKGQDLANLKALQGAAPYMIHVIEEAENIGYGRGANMGLDYLWQESFFDYFMVSNDDVVPVPTTLIELVDSMRNLEKSGEKPGVVGPVTNRINGIQQVDIGEFKNSLEMNYQAYKWATGHHSSATPNFQLRGLCMLIHPECLSEVGGFDPRFGWGNFEDDDHNLRCKLAGFTIWIAEGSFLYHHGSQTFQNLGIDYAANIERNQQAFAWKWDLANTEEWPMLDEIPEGTSLFVPLSYKPKNQFLVSVPGGEKIDLFEQASDIEFVAWVHERLKVRHRNLRKDIFKLIMSSTEPIQAVVEIEEEESANAA